MSKTIENLKSGNYEVVDNQGVSVTVHFVECLEKEFAEKDKAIENWETMYRSVMQSCHNSIEEDKRLIEQFAEKDQTIETILKENEELVKKHIEDILDKI